MKQRIIIIFILGLLAWHLALPVDLIGGADVGRHIKNGELILHGCWDVLYKNYYSYTEPGYPFINEHWLFGVFCYILWHWFGFTGLCLVYLGLELLTFYIFFRLAGRYASFPLACAFGLLSFPLLTLRCEVRPEGMSYLFCGLVWLMADAYQRKRLKFSVLAIASCWLQILWVNMHLFFIMGPGLAAAFWLQARLNQEREQAGAFQKLFGLLTLMCLINPSGLKGALMPLTIDPSYFLYPTMENFPPLMIREPHLRSAMLYLLVSIAMLLAVLAFVVKTQGVKKHFFMGTWALILSLAAIKVERMAGLYGFFWIPLAACFFHQWLPKTEGRKNIERCLVGLGIMVSFSVNFDWKQIHTLGVLPGTYDAAEFIKREKIPGPMFNNSDVGSYLIFELFPAYKVFIDNRIEPYTTEFIKEYLLSGDRPDVWRQLDRKYRFNMIVVFPERGLYKFINYFLIDKQHWALVFGGNNNALIFLKRDAQNERTIKSNEISAHIAFADF